MPLHRSSSLVATALAIFLAIPVQYYVPDFSRPDKDLPIDPLLTRPSPSSTDYVYWISLENLSLFDLFLTVFLLTLAMLANLSNWIQRKLMERRVIKMQQYLTERVERLHALDTRQQQLDNKLRMVQNVTSEYNLLLYLLLRRHNKAAPSHCLFDERIR